MPATSKAVLFGAGIAILVAAPAWAEITVKTAEYAAGILVVAGETSHPQREITIDDRYSETADAVGSFRFRIRYLPDDCTITLSDGEDRRSAFVRGCATTDGIDLKPGKDIRNGKPQQN